MTVSVYFFQPLQSFAFMFYIIFNLLSHTPFHTSKDRDTKLQPFEKGERRSTVEEYTGGRRATWVSDFLYNHISLL
jgi:hypothetical protein